jgi:beta-N-acetylhexosaminidase
MACVAALPRDVRIGQTMLVTSPSLSRVSGWLHDGLIGGVLANGEMTAAYAGAYRDAAADTSYGALLAVDEEGGQVQRYERLIGSFPSAQYQAATMTPAQVRALYKRVGKKLADWGVNVVFAPDADVGHGPGIGSRSYSSDPEAVADYATAAAEGLAAAGQIPVAKHFPGHGRASGDTHDALVTGPDIDELRRIDLVPFRRIIDDVPEAAVMVGHTTIPGYSDRPSSQSRAVVTELLRDDLGLGDRLVFSDALGMAASGADDQGDALVGFLLAGGDMGIIGPYGSVQGRRAVKAALKSGELTWDRVDTAAARVLAAKGIDPCSVVTEPPPSVPVDSGASDAPVVNPTVAP